MIDKLEVEVKAGTPFKSGFAELYSDLWQRGPKGTFRPSLHYVSTVDLRPFGYDAILHSGNKHTREGNHKLELVSTGTKTRSMMEFEMENIFDSNPKRNRIMRVDLATDVSHVPVEWFHSRMRVKYKRWSAKFRASNLEMVEMGMREMQTIYFGKRPNCLRVYDKVAEWKYQYQRLVRRKTPKGDPELIEELEEKMPSRFPVSESHSDFEIPAFEHLFGVPERGHILTRVERQIGGGLVPEQIGTVGRLGNAPEFNPFELVELARSGAPEPNPYDYDPKTYLAGMYLRERYESQGRQWVEGFLREHYKKNYKVRAQQFRDFLPVDEIDSDFGVNERDLYERYRYSVSRQLAA